METDIETVQKEIEEKEKDLYKESITKKCYVNAAKNADIGLRMVIYGLIFSIYDTAMKGLYGYFTFLFFTFLVLLLVSAKLQRGPLACWLSKPVDALKDTLTGKGKK